ncbi:NF-kappa-B-repressing factor [Bombina bombina]|uniref:NF-kappa-B-repressing factor n=1 Tax=Bombina bombina TaxID=8345 RepID=UPI00235B04F4|nr:NF-kappa-B-repressing factor [Bombina bombina]
MMASKCQLPICIGRDQEKPLSLEDFRQYHESDKHWDARKQFLARHLHLYPGSKLDQLISLSVVWSNIVFIGNRYGEHLTKKVLQMGEGIDVGEIPSYELVPGTKASKRPCNSDLDVQPQRKVGPSYGSRLRFEPMRFVASSIKEETMDTHKSNARETSNASYSFMNSVDAFRRKFYNLEQQSRDDQIRKTSALSSGSERPYETEDLSVYTTEEDDPDCEANSLHSPEANNANIHSNNFRHEESDCKRNPCPSFYTSDGNSRQKCITSHTKSYPEVMVTCADDSLSTELLPGHMQQVNSQDSDGSLTAQEESGPIKGIVLPKPFILTENASNAVSILNNSAMLNKMVVDYKYDMMPNNTWRCRVFVQDQCVSEEYGNKKSSKHAAAEAAVEILKKMQPNLQNQNGPTISNMKKAPMENAISRSQLCGLSSKAAYRQPIKEDNIGNQLLRKMGWTGGGLGREGAGRAEPVFVMEQSGRAGIGLPSISRKLNARDVEQIIRNYAKSHDQNDLTFSMEFTNEERKSIHQIVHKYGLRSKSYGKGTERYLVVSRKVSEQALINQLRQFYSLKPSCN